MTTHRHLVLLATISLGGCGRIGYDAAGTVTAPDASVELGPFGVPTLVMPLSDPSNDDDPTATDDLLELYFSSNRPGGAGSDDIWVATRGSVDEAFGAPTPVEELNTGDDETAPELVDDGLTMFFASNRPGVGSRDIYVTTRTSRAAPWSPPQLVSVLSTPSDETAPTLDATTLTLVYNNRESGASQLWESRRSSVTAPFQSPSPITELDNSGAEGSPRLDASGLLLLFAADDEGQGCDLLQAQRPSLDEPFGPPEIIRELQTSADEVDPWLSPDGRTLFFASNQEGNDEIYQATR